ncbi:MAG: response regulator [Gemmatimonadales bacterium]|nr:MAG: response regulator [Gemmatimonadales bacterium]
MQFGFQIGQRWDPVGEEKRRRRYDRLEQPRSALRDAAALLRTRAFVIISLVVLAVMAGLLSWGIHLSNRALDDRFSAWEVEREATVRLMLEQIYDEMLLMATVFSHDRELHSLFVEGRNAVLAEGGGPGGAEAARARSAMLERIGPAWGVASDLFKVRQLHFHIGPGSLSFLRVHAPESYGDTMHDLRHIIVDATAEGEPKRGFELGRIYSGLRGVVPIFEAPGQTGGTAIGALEVGTSFDPVLQRIVDVDAGGFAVVLEGTRVDDAMFMETRHQYVEDFDGCPCVLEASTGGEIRDFMQTHGSLLLSPLRGENPSRRARGVVSAEGGDRQYVVASWPLPDYLADSRGDPPPGVMVTWDDVTDVVAEHRAGIVQLILLGFVGFFVLEGASLLSILVAYRSMTSRVRDATAEARQSRREAEEASAAKSRFLAAMSHEIRNPMNGVVGMTELLSRTPLNREQERMLEAIRLSGDMLMSTINEVLDVSRIETGRFALESEAFSLVQVTERVQAVQGGRVDPERVRLAAQVTGSAPWRRGDERRVEGIVQNLVSNAVKFTESGEVIVRVDVSKPARVMVEVSDTGIGMTPEQQEIIFQPFVQADAATNRNYGGSGLGLAIVQGLVEAMDGSVEVESEPGRGSTFTVHLPLEAVAPPGDRIERHPVSTEVDLEHETRGSRPRAMVVDDDRISRMVLSALLERAGFQVSEADGGRKAVDAVRTDPPFHVVFMDITMPEVDGVDAIREIRALEVAEDRPRTPVVACTGNALSEQVKVYLSEGFDAHLAKPVTPDSIQGVLREVETGGVGTGAAV